MSSEHPILGIDHGEARIGLAITDPVGIMAHPLDTIQQKTENAVERIAEIATERQVKGIVLGLPLRMDGSEGSAAEKIHKFAAQLEERLPHIPLELHDERMTTMSAAQKLQQAGKNTKKQRAIIDQAAAVEILTDWLNSQNNGLLPPPEGG